MCDNSSEFLSSIGISLKFLINFQSIVELGNKLNIKIDIKRNIIIFAGAANAFKYVPILFATSPRLIKFYQFQQYTCSTSPLCIKIPPALSAIIVFGIFFFI